MCVRSCDILHPHPLLLLAPPQMRRKNKCGSTIPTPSRCPLRLMVLVPSVPTRGQCEMRQNHIKDLQPFNILSCYIISIQNITKHVLTFLETGLSSFQKYFSTVYSFSDHKIHQQHLKADIFKLAES